MARPSAALALRIPEDPSPPDRDVLSADEVAAWLRVDRRTIYAAANRHAIPHRRLGRQLRFSRQALLLWLGAHADVTSDRSNADAGTT